jgi:2-polyprenyl-3-methyl-5-hydroxy-6-metoxy-1,4-benzoquinol methylase
MKLKSLAKSILKHTPFYPVHIGNYIRNFYFLKYLEKLPVEKFTKVLDAGCGSGLYAEQMAQKFPWITVIAVDVKKQDFQFGQLSNLLFREGDLLKLEDSNSYDFIYCVDVLEHIPNNVTVMENFYHALKDGGYLYLHMPYVIGEKRIFPERFFEEFNRWADKDHIGKQYKLDEIKLVLQKLGFEIIGAEYTIGFLGKLAWELDRITDRNLSIKVIMAPLSKSLALISTKITHRAGNFLVIAKK